MEIKITRRINNAISVEFQKRFIKLLLFSSFWCFWGCHSGAFPELKKKPGEVAPLITGDLLQRPDFMLYQTSDVKAIHYAEICAAYGAVKFAGIEHDDLVIAELQNRYHSKAFKNIPNTANHVDANVYGILPLEFFMHTHDSADLAEGLKYADAQWENPLPDGLSAQTRFWIDDIYMIGCLQVQAYRATGNEIYLQRAALEIDAYIQKLQQPNGLFFHGTDARFYWGRGNGWVAAGMAELLSELPDTNPHYASILRSYQKMMQTLVENQSEDGMWHQLIDKPESFAETSSTAMFGFAISVGVKKGFLPQKSYKTAYIKAWNALVGYLNEDGKMREVCVGTGQSNDVQYYLDRPRTVGDLHGQAPMLWFAGSLTE